MRIKFKMTSFVLATMLMITLIPVFQARSAPKVPVVSKPCTIPASILAEYQYYHAERPLMKCDLQHRQKLNWWINTPQTLYVLSENQEHVISNVPLPYFSNSGNAGNDFNSEIPGVRDIMSEYGWELLYWDFGFPGNPTIWPKLLLYNKWRGILRFFYYNAQFDPIFSYGLVSMTKQSGCTPYANLTLFDNEKPFLDVYRDTPYDPDIKKLTQYAIGPLTKNEWNYVDFYLVGYDNELPEKSKLWFKFTGVHEVDYDFESGVTATVMPILKNHNLTFCDLQSDGDIDWVDFLGSTMSGLSNWADMLDLFYGLIDDGAYHDPDTTQYLESLATGLFYAGVPFVAAGIPFFTAFNGGGNANNAQALAFTINGRIYIKGKSTELDPQITFLMQLPGSNHGAATDNLPEYDLPLGIFGVKTRPELMLKKHIDLYSPPEFSKARFLLNITKPIEVVTNPNIDANITFTAAYSPNGITAIFTPVSLSDINTNTYEIDVNGLQTTNFSLYGIYMEPSFFGNITVCATVNPNIPPSDYVPPVISKTFPATVIHIPPFNQWAYWQ